MHKPNRFENPVLVTQRSLLRHLEIWCVEQETNGAVTSVEEAFDDDPKGVGHVQFGRLDLNDNPVKLRFTRDEAKGKFAPYEMEVI